MEDSVVFTSWRQCATHLTHASLGSPESSNQIASRSVQPFLHSSRNIVPILHNGPLSPLKTAASYGDLDPHLTHGSLGPPESSNQMESRSVHRLLHSSMQSVLIFYNALPLSPSKLSFLKARDDQVASGISWTTCKSFAPRSRQITMSAPHHLIPYRVRWST